jgi:hypothetical protein
MKNQMALSMVAVFLVLTALGCGGSSVADDTCTGTVTYRDQTFEGKGKDDNDAKHNACNNYCRDADPEYEARYAIWLDSPKGKAAGSPSKREAIFKDESLMKFVTENCSNRCVAEMNPSSWCKK